ncbi:hypothetical protein PVE_P0015 (plasmid) [Pseudomonas veronii 1YdBTEX2]|uniref:Uncharacterized protein n=2 Tax=Pseudomonas veronii TaxID=76761 RepID=A0A7Y1ABD6_PSEVE|nr:MULTISPECIES: hypothetical protein [Pseudomonas]SBW85060.1 hypothetical protein PVE_P0015 [Pseudomonas veronii 1YdBTEX2]KAA0945508.1 hypothetical protein FQ186_28365 [Pseudomonas sp. ANT_H14]KAA0946354.1 hypothetical protein FQ182_14465 [Pseudomonas sp. ANT_H4]MBI6552634.1 hypothetical protein [Pseudomonas veronii]MBI6652729.1 hypothetical protein [Pseudomonas veronii]
MSNDTAQSALRKMDSDLELHHRTWEIDGDLYRCRHCKSGQLASKGAEKFVHASDCAARRTVSDHPWLDLVRHTEALSMPTPQIKSCSGVRCQLDVARVSSAECHFEQVGHQPCLHKGPKEETYV